MDRSLLIEYNLIKPSNKDNVVKVNAQELKKFGYLIIKDNNGQFGLHFDGPINFDKYSIFTDYDNVPIEAFDHIFSNGIPASYFIKNKTF